MKYIGYIFTFIMTVFINATINGWAFSVLWKWFIVSTFGLPALSIPVAIGLLLTVGFLMPPTEGKVDDSTFIEKMLGAFGKALFKSSICVGSGYVILQFV